MCHEDLEAIYDLGQRNRAIAFPLIERIGIVDIDDEILFLALIMNLGLRSVSAHIDVAGQVIGCAVFVDVYLLGPGQISASRRVEKVEEVDR